MEPDFSGYATKAGIKCADGRTIMRDAFKHQDQTKVPLVWHHGGKASPENVLGHVMLENRDDGVYAYGFFNDTEKAKHAKGLVAHGDIDNMSIWANDLMERSKHVLHGTIREVSLVLSGANPGAIIENVTISHSDGDDYVLDDEAIIYSGSEFEDVEYELIMHEDSGDDDDDDDDDADDEETIGDIFNSMSEKQKNVLYYMVGEAMATSDTEEDNKEKAVTHSNDEKDDTMGKNHNVFEKSDDTTEDNFLSHEAVEGIMADAMRMGSLKDAVDAYALAHGIENIGVMFPDAKSITDSPDFFKRRTEWVDVVLKGVSKTPFARVRSLWADLTYDEARAKGYIKGNFKREEFFPVAKRETTPTTIYKKQKLDRDDIIDITDFDVVAWMKGEMGIMLDEEVARAVLVGDGREYGDPDKVNEGNIRPIASDHDLYTTKINVNLDDVNSSVQEITDAIVGNRHLYRGSGLPTMFTKETIIAKFLLLKDSLGRRIYKTLDELATELRVAAIVPVEVLEEEEYDDIVCILVNLSDYNIGANKGGEISMFDDFDIDYNQHKYLIETRMSGALVKLKSAMVVKKVAQAKTLVTPNKPTFDPNSGEITIVDQQGVVYKNADGNSVMNNSGSPYAVSAGEAIMVVATPDTGYYFEVNNEAAWIFSMPEAED